MEVMDTRLSICISILCSRRSLSWTELARKVLGLTIAAARACLTDKPDPVPSDVSIAQSQLMLEA